MQPAALVPRRLRRLVGAAEPDNQLSLAIGKAGQNVRLAARLTGWRIDIRSEAQVARNALMAIAPSGSDSEEESLADGSVGLVGDESYGVVAADGHDGQSARIEADGAPSIAGVDMLEDTDHALVETREATESAGSEETGVK